MSGLRVYRPLISWELRNGKENGNYYSIMGYTGTTCSQCNAIQYCMYIRTSLLGAGGLSKFLEEEIALLVGLPALFNILGFGTRVYGKLD